MMSKNKVSRREILKATALGGGSLILAACAPSAVAEATVAPAPAPAPTAVPEPTAIPATEIPEPTAVPSGPRKGGSLVSTANGDLAFDPYFNIGTNAESYRFFSSLFDYNGENPLEPHPQLAESWEESNQMLIIKIKEGVKFHNGREVVAQDVVDNVARAKDKSIGHYLFGAFDPSVESAEALNKYTVKIIYKKPYPVKLQDLTPLYIIPKEEMANVATTPVGSGPFKFVSYTPGDKLEILPFSDYWEMGKPYVDKVTVKIIADPQARLLNLLSGTVDIIDRPKLSDVSLLNEGGMVETYTSPPGGVWYGNVLNCGKKPFSNKQVRQALNYSIDRAKVSKLAYFGLSPVTQSRYLPTDFWYHEKASNQYGFDLQRAKELLAEGGYPNGLKTTIAVCEAVLPGSKAMSEVWAKDLETIGVTLEIVLKEQAPFYDEYFKGDYEIQAYGLGDGLMDPATTIGAGSPYRLVNNRANITKQPFFEEYSKLVDQGISLVDPNQRKPIYDRLQEIITDEGFVVMTAFWTSYFAVSKRVKGFKVPGDKRPFYSELWIEDPV